MTEKSVPPRNDSVTTTNQSVNSGTGDVILVRARVRIVREALPGSGQLSHCSSARRFAKPHG